jgi:hypothetical protein
VGLVEQVEEGGIRRPALLLRRSLRLVSCPANRLLLISHLFLRISA